MVRLSDLLRCSVFCSVVPLAAQVSPFVDSSAFGGTKLFLDGIVPAGGAVHPNYAPGFFALGFATGDQGSAKFMSYLDDVSSGDPGRINNAIAELADSPWGLRSRAYGLAWRDRGAVVSLTREEMTSLWTSVLGSETGTLGFDVRRSVVERFSLTYTSQDRFFYGGTLRIERWGLGNAYQELSAFSLDANLSRAKDLLDYSETQNRSITYAVDAFTGVEIANSLRLALQTNRLASRHLGDIEEKPQFRAGVQIDLGMMAQLTLESDINEAMRVPFPVMQKTALASLKIRANALITFAIGVERKTMDGQQTTNAGLNAWITGRKHRLGAGFQFGQDRSPWGATWKIQ